MSDYTHLNLKDVDDQAPNFGLSPDLEFRMARVGLGLEHSGLSYLRIAPGFRLPFGHKHKNQEEVYVLVSGGARSGVPDRRCAQHRPGGRGDRPGVVERLARS